MRDDKIMSIMEKINGIRYIPEDVKHMINAKNASIYDYEITSQKYNNLYTMELLRHNDFYYNAYHIKKYCGLSGMNILKASIEHGVRFDKDGVWPPDIEHNFDNIITFGDYRREILEKLTDKKIIEIGPYIAYANSFYSESQIDAIRKKNGKTLTVFPSHSTMQVDMEFDIAQLINEIERVGKQFDSILVCLYWKDIALGKYEQYEKAGFRVVCAGHMYDKNFLPRLKSILMLSDMIMSNDLGTYIGHALYLNIPCYIYQMQCSANTNDISSKEEYNNRSEICQIIFDNFNYVPQNISPEQRELGNYVWGIDKVKTAEELKKIIKSL